jgi:hypothetical protein
MLPFGGASFFVPFHDHFPMKTHYTLDCEFNGLGGQLLSMALYTHGRSIYLVSGLLRDLESPEVALLDPWVVQNVVPFVFETPPEVQTLYFDSQAVLAEHLERFFARTRPIIHTDWPDDIKYFCEALITAPGSMIDVPGIGFEMHHVDSYPTTVVGAIQHNAWWDARVLYKHLLALDTPESIDLSHCHRIASNRAYTAL